MRSSIFNLQRVALALALAGVAGASQATVTVFTTKAAFDAAVASLIQATDTFSDLTADELLSSPQSRTLTGGLSYTASSTTSGDDGFFPGSTASIGGIYLGNNSNLDTITFGDFSAGVMGLSGNFFGSNASGAFTNRAMTVTATDASGTVTQLLTPTTANPLGTTFVGFLSDSGLISVTTFVTVSAQNRWASADNITLAAAAVPEPSGYALMFAGLGAIAWVARRRKA